MSVTVIVCFLAVAYVTAALLNDKPTHQTKTGRIQLGMSFDDPRVINQGAACPPDCPRDCKDVYDQGHVVDGIYTIYISVNDYMPLLVYCDMQTSGGGWTVFQRRINGAIDFYRDWVEYVDGFGQLTSEYWLGLDNLHLLLAQNNYRLRVDLVDFNGSTPYAEYAYFTVGSPFSKYALGINMYLGGSAGDSLKNLDYGSAYYYELTNMKFSTRDQDNDVTPDFSCVESRNGAWWHKQCSLANLNGVYTTNTTSDNNHNIYWFTWNIRYALKAAEMKFRPMTQAGFMSAP